MPGTWSRSGQSWTECTVGPRTTSRYEGGRPAQGVERSGALRVLLVFHAIRYVVGVLDSCPFVRRTHGRSVLSFRSLILPHDGPSTSPRVPRSPTPWCGIRGWRNPPRWQTSGTVNSR